MMTDLLEAINHHDKAIALYEGIAKRKLEDDSNIPGINAYFKAAAYLGGGTVWSDFLFQVRGGEGASSGVSSKRMRQILDASPDPYEGDPALPTLEEIFMLASALVTKENTLLTRADVASSETYMSLLIAATRKYPSLAYGPAVAQ